MAHTLCFLLTGILYSGDSALTGDKKNRVAGAALPHLAAPTPGLPISVLAASATATATNIRF